MGSGTTLRAAKDLGPAPSAMIAAKRMEQTVMAL
jgi:hypothetical protein